MEPRRKKLSDLLHGSALPPPKIKRALIFGVIAAVLAATACGMAAYTHELRLAHLLAGIGVLVGFAILRARGYGKTLTMAAAGLTLLAMPAAYFLAFVLTTVLWCNERSHADGREDAAAWQLLSNPSDEQVFEFAKEQSLAFTSRQAFDHYPGKMLSWFADNQPTLSEWRTWEYQHSSFGDYLTFTTSTLDYVLAIVAMLLAAGIVHLRTAKLEARAKQKMIARRQEQSRDAVTDPVDRPSS